MSIRFRSAAVMVCLITVAAACSSGNEEGPEGAIEPAILRATPQPTGQVEMPTPVREGRAVDKYLLETSECFNRYDLYSELLDETTELTTVVDCRRPHDGEVYATYFHPAPAEAPYPGNADMEQWGKLSCYNEFGAFVGKDFELSALEVGIIRPTERTWTGEGLHREVTCYVFVADAQLEGPMGGSEI